MNANEDWYYFNESDKKLKTGWHHDGADGYWYYLDPSNGKMMTGWQTIDGKEYFFQPVRNVGNYYFSSDREKWLYSLNSNVPYGAMYTATTTPDGSAVDETGVKGYLQECLVAVSELPEENVLHQQINSSNSLTFS